MTEQQYTFPQYAKTSDQRVVVAIEEAQEAHRVFHEAACALSEKYTGERDQVWMRGNWILGASAVGISAHGIDNLPGKWTKPERGVSRPYKNNPAYAEFSSLSTRPADIPGRASMEFGERNGQEYMGCGTLFVHRGTAYSAFTFQPNERSSDPAEFGWEEIKASEWHKAREDFREQEDS